MQIPVRIFVGRNRDIQFLENLGLAVFFGFYFKRTSIGIYSNSARLNVAHLPDITAYLLMCFNKHTDTLKANEKDKIV